MTLGAIDSLAVSGRRASEREIERGGERERERERVLFLLLFLLLVLLIPLSSDQVGKKRGGMGNTMDPEARNPKP